MKFLAFTNEDQGIIIDANNWDDAKYQLKQKLTKSSFLNEVKLLNLADGTEKSFIPNIQQKGGADTKDLYNIANTMNESTKQLVQYLKNNEQQIEQSNEQPNEENQQMSTKQYVIEPEHPQCSIM